MPAIDDGAKNKEESIKMLKDSFEDGVRLCVATPHCIVHREEDIRSFLVKRENSFKEIENDIKGQGFPRVILGAEVFLDNDISRYEGIEKLCAEGGSAMLIELKTDKFSKDIGEWIYSLTMKNITPVIAHIERYPYALQLIEELSDMSVYYQINAVSLLCLAKRRLIKRLLRTGKTFFVSSDKHNTTSRSPLMREANRAAQKRFKKNNKCDRWTC